MVPEDHNQNETNMQSADELQDASKGSAAMTNSNMSVMLDFWRAMVLLSRVPVFQVDDFRPAVIARSVWSWPLVGLVLAGLALLPAMLVHSLTENTMIFAIIVVAFMVLLTGAMHEDGMADCADGFGGGVERSRKLEIMRDSQIGTYGVVALILCLSLRLTLLYTAANIGQAAILLLCTAVMSRAAMPVVMRVLPPARDNGLGKGAGRPGLLLMAIGFVIAIAVVWALAGIVATLAVLLGAVIAICLVVLIAKRQIGGQTGDVLGATQLSAELFAGIGFIAVMGGI
ncbi:MAG: adenosylcobinamide-GDP ribazoletransferase [Rhodospirillales bacterium]|nr:adenosylcobinamide-GDP ribazoletransferase [Rhodospirillales bacterium]